MEPVKLKSEGQFEGDSIEATGLSFHYKNQSESEKNEE